MRYLFFLTIATLLILTGCSSANVPLSNPTNKKALDTSVTIFKHGVASGDPMSDKVIIWTRVTTTQKIATVKWQISEDVNFKAFTMSGQTTTDASKDFTVKVDVHKLKSNTNYHYRFVTEGKSSPIGKTKTLAEGSIDQVRLGVVSCSNYEFGYFNAYQGLADSELDAILHLGDYIYEYGPNRYGDKAFSRKHLPAKEITTIDDYRTRYAQYREDKGLQRAHQQHPFIMIWDDHEIANNAYKDGAQNHQDDEGDYQVRKKIAKQAYYEWQPIRETGNKELYRSFKLGNLVDLIMLDERYTGRHEPTAAYDKASEERTMLGAAQLNWFKNELKISKATWKIIGNQVIFSPCDLSMVRPDSPINLDAWDGYAYERDDIRAFLTSSKIDNTILVTGDTHSSWAFEVPELGADYKTTGKTSAVEIGTPSITSANWNESETASDEQVIMGEQALRLSNPHLKFVNGRDHGYVILDISPSETKAQWFYTADIKTEMSKITKAREMKIPVGELKLVDVEE